MSRTKKGAKAPGWGFCKRNPLITHWQNGGGRSATNGYFRRLIHKAERVQGRLEIARDLANTE